MSRRRRISSAFSNSGWAWAYFPWASRAIRLLIHGIGRLVGDSILVRHRGHPAQRLEAPLRVHRLEVLRPLDPRPQGEQFLGLRNRLVPAIGLQGLVDLLVQFLARFSSSPVSLRNPGAGG